jgi:hypothetical protein
MFAENKLRPGGNTGGKLVDISENIVHLSAIASQWPFDPNIAMVVATHGILLIWVKGHIVPYASLQILGRSHWPRGSKDRKIYICYANIQQPWWKCGMRFLQKLPCKSCNGYLLAYLIWFGRHLGIHHQKHEATTSWWSFSIRKCCNWLALS